jgi:hypothetical protein
MVETYVSSSADADESTVSDELSSSDFTFCTLEISFDAVTAVVL